MAISQVGGTGSGRLVTKQNTAGAVSLGGASGTVPAWCQMSASLAADVLITKITAQIFTGSFANIVILSVGVGAAGSEVVLASEPALSLNPGSTQIVMADLSMPIRVAAGQRVALRTDDPSGGVVSLTAYGALFANLEGN